MNNNIKQKNATWSVVLTLCLYVSKVYTCVYTRLCATLYKVLVPTVCSLRRQHFYLKLAAEVNGFSSRGDVLLL